MGILISAHHSSDINVVRKEIDSALELINIDMNRKPINTDDYNQNGARM